MAWPPRSLGLVYSSLFRHYGTRIFRVSEAMERLALGGRLRVYLHRLCGLGWAHPFRVAGRGSYRLLDPELCILQAAGVLRPVPARRLGEYTRLVTLFSQRLVEELEGLLGLVVYGSVARGSPRPNSDVDVIVVLEDRTSLRRAFDQMVDVEGRPPISAEISFLAEHGLDTHISLLPLSESRFRAHPPILLDVAEDGLVIVDRAGVEAELHRIRNRLGELGAKRVFIGEDDWYWDLIPKYSPGVEVEV